MAPTNTLCCGVITFVTVQKPNRFFFLRGKLHLGGGKSNISCFHPWGFMIQFDLRIFFQMGWFNHPTSLHDSHHFIPWKTQRRLAVGPAHGSSEHLPSTMVLNLRLGPIVSATPAIGMEKFFTYPVPWMSHPTWCPKRKWINSMVSIYKWVRYPNKNLHL